MDQARDRLDFVPRRDFDALKAQVDALRQQVEHHLTSSVHHTHGGGAAGASGAAGFESGAQVHGELHTHPGDPTHDHPGGAAAHAHETGGAGPGGGPGAPGAGPTGSAAGGAAARSGAGDEPGTLAGDGRARSIPVDEGE